MKIAVAKFKTCSVAILLGILLTLAGCNTQPSVNGSKLNKEEPLIIHSDCQYEDVFDDSIPARVGYFDYNKSNVGYVHVSNLNAADSSINKLQSDNNFTKVILENEADLDMDGNNDVINVAKPKEQDDRNFDLEISIYRTVNGKSHLWQHNILMFKDPINGCMMEGLEDIILNTGNFNIEYTSCYDNKHAKRFVSFSYNPQSDDFKVTKNIISFFNSESNEMNQTFNCKDNEYLFSSYNDSCEW